MKHLKEIKDPEKILNGTIEISEKIDGSSLHAEKSNGEIKFYGREKRNEIDIIRRTAIGIYEDPINHLLSSGLESIMKDGDHLVFEFFFPGIKSIVKLKRKPESPKTTLFCCPTTAALT